MTVLFVGFLAVIVIFGRNETRSEQLPWVYGLFIGFGLALTWWVWYNYVRIVFWTVDGIGIRQALVTKRFVRWEEVEWAGLHWSGDFQIRSKSTKINYASFQGGHDQLNRFVRRKLPNSAGNF